MKINDFVLQHLRASDPETVFFINNTAYSTFELLEAVESGDEILLNRLAGEFINYLTENKSEPYQDGHSVFTDVTLSSSAVSFTALTYALHKQSKRLAARAYLDDRPPSFYGNPVITRLSDAIHKRVK